jgi:hypothetical protein
MVFAILSLMLPGGAMAWPGKFASCSSCHGTADPDGTVTTAINGVAGTTVTVAPGGSFEVDFIIRNVAGAGVMGIEAALPSGWTFGTSTVNSPALGGWNAVWENAAGAIWAGNKNTATTPYDTSGEFPNSPDGFTINFDGTGWDSGTRDAAFDDASGGDLDGTANEMGGDITINVPVGAAETTYTVQITGVGHDGTKAFKSQAITVTVSSGGDTTPPNVTTTVPTNGATGVALNGSVTINFDENIDCTTVNTTNITSDSPGWTFSSCSAAQAVFTTSGQANNTTYNVSVTAAVTDLAANALNAAPYNFSYTTTPGDVTPPNVTTTVPANAATGVALDGNVTINFDENIDCGTVNVTNITSDSPGWTFSSCSAAQAIFTTSGQANSTAYSVNVITSVTDVAGNPLSAAYPFSYTTTAAANNSPALPVNLAQYLLDGITPTAVGGYTTEASVVFEGDLSDPDADTVKIQIDTDSDGTFNCESALVASGSNNVQVTCAVADGSYDWQARTVDSVGANSGWVAFNAASPDYIKDASAPTDGTLTATAGDTQIDLSWTAASDVHSGVASPAYKVVRASGTTTPPADCSGAAIYTGDNLSYSDTGLTNGVDYAYRVCANNNAGLQSAGSTDTAQPAAGCTYSDPTVTMLTASKDIATDGGFADYTVQVTNNDAAACGNTTFNLSVNDSNGANFYGSTLSPTSLNLAPGASAQATLRVTARANQPNSSTNNSSASTAVDGNHGAVTSTAVTSTINVSGGGCTAAGDYQNTNGDQFTTSR